MEQNNHIIVGEPRRCLCGTYEINGVKIPVGCSEIIKAMETVRDICREGRIAHAAVTSCVVDCSDKMSPYEYAVHLARSIYNAHYSDAQGWQPLDDTLGVLTQIDNMIAGLVHRLSVTNDDARRLAAAIIDWKSSQGKTRSGDILDDALEAHEKLMGQNGAPAEPLPPDRHECNECG